MWPLFISSVKGVQKEQGKTSRKAFVKEMGTLGKSGVKGPESDRWTMVRTKVMTVSR